MRETPLIATGMSQYATYKLHSSRPGDFRRHELAEIPFESAVDARQMTHRNRARRSKRTCMAVFPNEFINSFGNTKRPTGIEGADRHLIAHSKGISAIFRVRFPETGHLRRESAKTTRGLCAQDTERGRARRVDLPPPDSTSCFRTIQKNRSETGIRAATRSSHGRSPAHKPLPIFARFSSDTVQLALTGPSGPPKQPKQLIHKFLLV